MGDLDRHPSARRAAAAIVVLTMVLAATTLWTAIPLCWIYVASTLSRTQFPAGEPYMVLVIGMVGSVVPVGWLIARLRSLHMRITGADGGQVEVVLVASVALALLVALVWFFFGSGGAEPNTPLG
jgi:hypothetical protein